MAADRNESPLRIGLTGGIASGKSTVADMLAELGAAIIDTDLVARQVVEPGQPALDEIRSAFGDEVIAADGRLDRSAMRRIAFSDDAARKRLEAVVHPRIREETVRQSEAASGDYQVVVVPLLVESPLKAFVDRILVVDCAEETQLRRLVARDAESGDQARRMLAAQASRAERLAIADDVVSNDGDLEQTKAQIAALHAQYLRLAGARTRQ